ncbi:hypothetical protein R3P38DRAFT_3173193 [Favolaschia claudopus]|uniref:Uncharacterized protein n=1 Tax=Favolaschia claudopus TaxID=2862362 RepID=A0AAW0DG25_9AGAR
MPPAQPRTRRRSPNIHPVKLRFLRFHWDEYLSAKDRGRVRDFYSRLTDKYFHYFGLTMVREEGELPPTDVLTLSEEELQKHIALMRAVEKTLANWYRQSDGIWMP